MTRYRTRERRKTRQTWKNGVTLKTDIQRARLNLEEVFLSLNQHLLCIAMVLKLLLSSLHDNLFKEIGCMNYGVCFVSMQRVHGLQMEWNWDWIKRRCGYGDFGIHHINRRKECKERRWPNMIFFRSWWPSVIAGVRKCKKKG